MARTDSIIERFPSFYQSGDRLNNLYRWIEVFGKQVDIAEEDLIRVMRSHWVNTANNEDSKGFNSSEKGDLDKIFALYLEALGGTSLLKQVGRRTGEEGIEDDKIYRDRIKGLIHVLREGASTKEGIISIVAANLGIVGDSAEAQKARGMIHIEEFLPEPLPLAIHHVAFGEEFLVTNPNNIHVVPQVNLVMTTNLRMSLMNLELINVSTGESCRVDGTMIFGREMIWLTDGTASLDGQLRPTVGRTPRLKPGVNKLAIRGAFGIPAGVFDEAFFDRSLFDVNEVGLPGLFDETYFDETVFTDGTPVVTATVRLNKYTPGTFNVRVPWDIPGYSEILETLSDKPRDQILFIVNKVKAAGTYAILTYEKRFEVTQPQKIELTVRDTMPALSHVQEEHDFSIFSAATPYPGGLNHEMQEQLTLSGVFDYTTFDSLNGFA